MSKLYPDYARNSEGEIPKEMCFDVLRIMPEVGGGYLWDMNGVCITVGCITENDDEPWDLTFEAWMDIYDRKPLNDIFDPIWESDQERVLFEKQGLELAQGLYEFFNQKRTVIYFDLDRRTTRFDASGKPPIRLTDQEVIAGGTMMPKRLGSLDGEQVGQGKP
jgi:hypothetical protein